jgi:hypothetical protein
MSGGWYVFWSGWRLNNSFYFLEVSLMQLVKEVPLIQLIINVLGIFIAALLAYLFGKQRYAFEKLHDRKLVCLEEMYGKIISLEKSLREYTMLIGNDMKESNFLVKRKWLGSVIGKVHELKDFFQEKEIMLSEDTVLVVQAFLDTSSETTSNLQASVISQKLNDAKISNEQWKIAKQIIGEKLKEAKEQLKKEFRSEVRK